MEHVEFNNANFRIFVKPNRVLDGIFQFAYTYPVMLIPGGIFETVVGSDNVNLPIFLDPGRAMIAWMLGCYLI